MEMIGFPFLARSHTTLAWVPGGPIPDDFWVVWEGHPFAHTHFAMVPNVIAEMGKKPFVYDRRTPAKSSSLNREEDEEVADGLGDNSLRFPKKIDYHNFVNK